MRTVFQILAVILGPVMVGVSYNWFYMPHLLVSGGLGGIALLLSQSFGWSTGLQVLLYNIPILWGAQKHLGRKFLLLTAVGIAAMTATLALLPVRPVIADDPLLNAIFGGIICGAGVTSGAGKKTVMVVTSQAEAVAERINAGMGRGVTMLDGKGAYSRESRSVLFCVVTRYELSQIKEIVTAADTGAFMAVLETESVAGRFRPYNPLAQGLKP